jgi:acetolactate decarboxylase
MKHATRIALGLMIVCLLALGIACAPVTPLRNYALVTQISTYPALQFGVYNGDVTYAQIDQYGDFGIGTFNGMDGEMVALDGKFYQAKADGSVREADKTAKAPFATLNFFRTSRQVRLNEPIQNYDQLKKFLNRQLTAANRPYAFKVSATFNTLTIRSVPKQSEPFLPLTGVIAQQVTFDLKNIAGTLVGFWVPDYLANLNAPGYHLHFISNDKQHGGHMLECNLSAATIEINDLEQIAVMIPQNDAFQKTDFTQTPK